MDHNNQMEIRREGFGEGYDEREALVNWLSSEQFNEMGLGKGNAALDTSVPVLSERVRKPKVAKRAHVDRFKQEGSRKWKTRYRVENQESTACAYGDTQAEAIDKAKKLSLNNKEIFVVVCFKELEDGEKLVARVAPGNSRPGKWHFSAMFKW